MTNARNAKSTREKAAQLRAQADRQAARRKAITVGAIALAVLAFLVIIVIVMRSIATQASAPPRNLTDNAILSGNVTAPVKIDVYEDFHCSACRSFELANQEQLRNWEKAGIVKVYYHPVAILDPESGGSQYSTRAANAVAAVQDLKPEVTDKFHSLLFENFPQNEEGLGNEQLIEFAVTAGADKNAVSSAINELKFRGWVRDTTQGFVDKEFKDAQGKVRDRAATPTVLVDGVLTEKIAPEEFHKVVAEAAKKAGKTLPKFVESQPTASGVPVSPPAGAPAPAGGASPARS